MTASLHNRIIERLAKDPRCYIVPRHKLASELKRAIAEALSPTPHHDMLMNAEFKARVNAAAYAAVASIEATDRICREIGVDPDE